MSAKMEGLLLKMMKAEEVYSAANNIVKDVADGLSDQVTSEADASTIVDTCDAIARVSMLYLYNKMGMNLLKTFFTLS